MVVLAASMSAGCVGFPTWWNKSTPEIAVEPVKARSAVTAEQVNESNARQMADALLEEMDREARGDTAVLPENSPDSKSR
jgi:hypothetical protein